jgi:hypothetical protein
MTACGKPAKNFGDVDLGTAGLGVLRIALVENEYPTGRTHRGSLHTG